jgi:hypothetical protein
VHEPLAGTATRADVWVVVEAAAPYPRQAVTDLLPPAVVAWHEAAPGVRVVVARRPATRPVTTGSADRVILVAAAAATAGPVLHRGVVADVGALSAWDVVELHAGRPPQHGDWQRLDQPVFLVCSNGRRDPCCALRGGPAARALRDQHPDRVWETSHLGGHRFAPVIVRLPDGFQFGGPDGRSLSVAASRGRSALPPAAQAAELAVLHQLGLPTPQRLTVTQSADRWLVGHDGRRWQVTVVRSDDDRGRPESCGRPPTPVTSWHVTDLEELTP